MSDTDPGELSSEEKLEELSPEERIKQLESARRANLEQEAFLAMQRRDALAPESFRSPEEQQQELDRLDGKSEQVRERLADIETRLDSAREAAGIDPVAARKAQEENKGLESKLGEIESRRKMDLSALDSNARIAEKRIMDGIKDAQDRNESGTVEQLNEKLDKSRIAVEQSRNDINAQWDREIVDAREQHEQNRSDPTREEPDRPR